MTPLVVFACTLLLSQPPEIDNSGPVRSSNDAVCRVQGTATTDRGVIQLAALRGSCFGAYTKAGHSFGGKPVYIQDTNAAGLQVKGDVRWLLYYDGRLKRWAAGHIPDSPPSALCMMSEKTNYPTIPQAMRSWKMVAGASLNDNIHTCVSCGPRLNSVRSCDKLDSRIFRKTPNSFREKLAQAISARPSFPPVMTKQTSTQVNDANAAKLYMMVRNIDSSIIPEETPSPTPIPKTTNKLGDLTTLNLLRNIIQAGKTTTLGKQALSPKILDDVEKLLSDSEKDKGSAKVMNRDLGFRSGVLPTPAPTTHEQRISLGTATRAALVKALMEKDDMNKRLVASRRQQTYVHPGQNKKGEFAAGTDVKIIAGPFNSRAGVIIGVTHILTAGGVAAAYGVKLASSTDVIQFPAADLRINKIESHVAKSAELDAAHLVGQEKKNQCLQRLLDTKNICSGMPDASREYCVVHLCIASQQKGPAMRKNTMFAMQGFLSQDHQLGKLLMHNTADAKKYCDSNPECAGFSFRANAAAEGNMHHVWFKSSAAGFVPDKDWVTYLKFE